jgi:hypothetical protein
MNVTFVARNVLLASAALGVVLVTVIVCSCLGTLPKAPRDASGTQRAGLSDPSSPSAAALRDAGVAGAKDEVALLRVTGTSHGYSFRGRGFYSDRSRTIIFGDIVPDAHPVVRMTSLETRGAIYPLWWGANSSDGEYIFEFRPRTEAGQQTFRLDVLALSTRSGTNVSVGWHLNFAASVAPSARLLNNMSLLVGTLAVDIVELLASPATVEAIVWTHGASIALLDRRALAGMSQFSLQLLDPHGDPLHQFSRESTPMNGGGLETATEIQHDFLWDSAQSHSCTLEIRYGGADVRQPIG